jgi:hypothetical protein
LISWHSAADAALTECDFLTCGDASSSRSAGVEAARGVREGASDASN